MLRHGSLLAVVASFALAGCGEGQLPSREQQNETAPLKGIPSAHLAAAPQCTAPDVHQRHVSLFNCDVCHPTGATFGFDKPYAFPRGTTTAGGTFTLHTATEPATCAVACHSPMGGAPKSITWTAPAPLACTACHDTATTLAPAHPPVSADAPRSACLVCHDVSNHAVGSGAVALVGHVSGWMNPASPDFHAASANRGLANCKQCHASDLTGGFTGFSCGQCHDQKDAGGNVLVSWKSNCVMCHGGTDDQTGAPPKAIWGYAADAVRAGAHGVHVRGSALAPPVDCGVCHVKPADALAANHVDEVAPGNAPLATVVFGGMAIQGLAPRGITAAWDRAAATCSSTYCHGATLSGGTLNSPVWTTLDGSQAACGTCHGLPPPSPHPSVDTTSGTRACNACHAGTVDANGAVIPPSAGGKHLDGVVEAAGHAAEWMVTSSAGFHAYSADANLASCQGCHGANLDGVGGIASTACAKCHDASLPPGVLSWKTNCVMCHGGTDNQTGAPPKAIWGYAGDPNRGGGAADPVRAGAHSAHVTGISGGTALSAAFDCGVCHLKPADALSSGHLDGTTATVTFSGLAAQGGAPAWARATATCSSVYCHGSTLPGGTNKAPSWTSGAAQASCGTCHGVPPPASTGHVQNTDCGHCHQGYTQASVNPATHVNGTIDLVGLTCTTCHGDPARPATTLNPQRAAAPPVDTMGNAGTASAGVGAHQAHLEDGPLGAALACTECHTVPTSTANHPTGTLVLAWGALATTGGAQPSYSAGACSSTYCHGATLNAGGTNLAPRWTGGSAEVACGSCHGTPPPSPHPGVTGGLSACSGCHSATVDANGAIIAASAGGKHIDGVVQATGGHSASWMDTASPGFHAFSANQGLGSCQGCHGTNLDGAGGSTTVACAQCHDLNLPAGVTSWRTNCIMCHGGTDNGSGAPPLATWGNAADPVRTGAHTAHVSPALAAPYDCGVCHLKPGDALSPGHIDGPTATVTFGGTAVQRGVNPQWNRGPATCSSTYCHGATLTGGSATTPAWTQLDGTQKACTACHGRPPSTGRHSMHAFSWSIPCWACHPGAWNVPVQPSSHVDGATDLNPNGSFFGTFSDWSPTRAGTGTLRGTATGCHGGTYYWTGLSPTGSCN